MGRHVELVDGCLLGGKIFGGGPRGRQLYVGLLLGNSHSFALRLRSASPNSGRARAFRCVGQGGCDASRS